MTGQYSVLLPDGRVQTVTYSVAPNTGFVVAIQCTVYTASYEITRDDGREKRLGSINLLEPKINRQNIES